ncbi:alcohol dehydrogenase [Mycena venus]|uniref:Alcohol dehydrogenase n=1 Tax=Mycena venus TaxID=2733690 RepID=A0A8H6Y199_9AGAR|nr:alcohol dehydrogenase [Mycena venus]
MFAKLFSRAHAVSTKLAPESSQSSLEPRYVSSGYIDFEAAGLDEYNGCYAVVLDSLFSETELSAFLAQAEASGPWEVAQVNAGQYAYTDTSYRNGERLIYDSFELSEKIFEKVRPHLQDIEEIEQTTYVNGVNKAIQKWRMVRLNERLRFLRYPKGGFFRGHCDGAYLDPATKQRTFYTLQFYLPSDASGSKESFVPAQGGSTRFTSRTSTNHADVEAIPGRVLVFQHADLFHTGEEVTDGVKCTVRSDILYERVGEPVLVEKQES